MAKKKVICDKHVQHEVVIFKADTSMFPETVGVILRMVCSRRLMYDGLETSMYNKHR